MTYNVEFKGQWNLNLPLNNNHRLYLIQFSNIRHMKRDVNKVEFIPDDLRTSVGLTIGTDAEFFVGGGGSFGQERDVSILNYNKPPSTQPGLWNGWVPNSNGTAIIWDEIENFYNYVDWIQYMIKNFFNPWGYILNGDIAWQGNSLKDTGIINIENNIINLKR